ncbi:maleylpyruvate isomerase family mycothiol-dependent enzyme [Streptomyces sp. A7024]|uniref:Maleylpyruvate isomerase family mycothiol-dependent enzyme n=1 Tax=Streptomyces coryli TaxID=1128680 RepID=A0A6G4U8N3_9ACTN|nr:maleylpyruvate isomerase family mycothiol-dependent enzyme [Streptomyces coryli]NGN67748.1 maleylpyruvate isomerase family mycothiol-dependent enzyme [Streptomyces coryli]
MRTVSYIDYLQREGELLAAAADKAGELTPVPTCPGWTTGDLVRHTSTFHRWAARIVAERLPGPVPEDPMPDEPTGAGLLPWFRDGHGHLVRTLRTAGPETDCWAFMPAASPLTFWARRQAHETAVHRVDAESARGGELTPLDPDFAADGIDELLTGFHARPKSRVRAQRPRILRVRPSDAAAAWTVRLSPDAPPRTERSADGQADCELAGRAQDLYLMLWNRLPLTAATITGDAALAALWRETSQIT